MAYAPAPLMIVALPEGTVRTTPDKRVSVFDAIKAATGARNPRDAWNRLCKDHPEVVAKCDSYKFRGRGQLETPVTNKEGFLYILGLLPGETARTFREQSAKLVLRYLEGDPTLAEEVIDRQTDPAVLDRLALRAKGIGVRLVFCETLRAYGAVNEGPHRNTYAQATGLLNQAVFGHTAKAVQAFTGQKKTRDGLPSVYLSLLLMAEELAAANIRRLNAQGHEAELSAVGELANDVIGLRQKYVIPSFPPTDT